MSICNGAVFVSTKRNIFQNLAIEDWLYRNINFTRLNLSMLLMWQNGPSVVVGVHQNPWIECSVNKLKEHEIVLARRCSGGGTVYHDMGNLNCSFMTARTKYNRKDNLNIICKALQKWNLDVRISPRDDLFWNDCKISGTASKLGRENAYHHCTLLLDVNRNLLQNVLHKDATDIASKATSSVKSQVINLVEVCPHLKVEDVITEIANQYQQFHQVPQHSIHFIDGEESEFPGITEICERLKSWDFVFGKTPQLLVHRQYPVPVECYATCIAIDVSIKIKIYHGILKEVEIDLPVMRGHIIELQNSLEGEKLMFATISVKLFRWLANLDLEDKRLGKFISESVLDVVNYVYS